MPGGLSFLSKKSWHTSKIVNVERVFLAEEKAAEENKKLLELQKQIQEEREIQELRQLQVKNGIAVRTTDATLDWMYQGPSAETQSSEAKEEYLLGKIYKPKEEDKSDLHKIKQEKSAGSLWLNKVSSKNDTFSRVHEDPLLLMKQSEMKAKEKIINNPVKLAKIRRELELQLNVGQHDHSSSRRSISQRDSAKEEKSGRKKEKKEKKDSKKKHHKKSRHRSNSSSSDSEADAQTIAENECKEDLVIKTTIDADADADADVSRYDRLRDSSNNQQRSSRYDRQKSRSRERDTHKHAHTNSRSRSPDRNTDRYRRRDDSRGRDKHRHADRNDTYDRRTNSHTQRDDSRDRYTHRRRDSNDSRDRHREIYTHREDESDRKDDRRNRSRSRSCERKYDKRDSTCSNSKSNTTGSTASTSIVSTSQQGHQQEWLGPKLTLIQKMEESERNEANSKHVNKHSTRQLTKEEILLRRKEMEEDAVINDKNRILATAAAEADVALSLPTASQGQYRGGEATLLKGFANADLSMEDRLKQNRFYIQRSDDDSFIKR